MSISAFNTLQHNIHTWTELCLWQKETVHHTNTWKMCKEIQIESFMQKT